MDVQFRFRAKCLYFHCFYFILDSVAIFVLVMTLVKFDDVLLSVFDLNKKFFISSNIPFALFCLLSCEIEHLNKH